MTFHESLAAWFEAAKKHSQAKHEHDLAFGAALLRAEGRNAEQRKAQAEAEVTGARARADLAGVEERAAYHLMIHLRGNDTDGREELI